MSEDEALRPAAPEELNVLTFAVGGVRIGVDADQVSEMMDLETARLRGLETRYFHELIPFGRAPVLYHAPKVIMIKGVLRYGLVIDAPDNIEVFSIDEIRPLPLLVSDACKSRFWGAVQMQDGILLLMDPEQRSGDPDDIQQADLAGIRR